MSDERLKQSLVKAGLPTAAINVLDRQALISTWAELVAAGRNKPVAPSPAAYPLLDPELEKRRLDFEERKWAEKLQIEREELRLQMETYDNPASIFKRYRTAMLYEAHFVVCHQTLQIYLHFLKMRNVYLAKLEHQRR